MRVSTIPPTYLHPIQTHTTRSPSTPAPARDEKAAEVHTDPLEKLQSLSQEDRDAAFRIDLIDSAMVKATPVVAAPKPAAPVATPAAPPPEHVDITV
jgi:hypothetical protein